METMATTSANSKGVPWLVSTGLLLKPHLTYPPTLPYPATACTSTDHWSRGTPDVDMTAGSSAPVPWRWGLSGGGGVGVCLAHHKQVTNTLISIQCIQYCGCGGWSAFQHHTRHTMLCTCLHCITVYLLCYYSIPVEMLH